MKKYLIITTLFLVAIPLFVWAYTNYYGSGINAYGQGTNWAYAYRAYSNDNQRAVLALTPMEKRGYWSCVGFNIDTDATIDGIMVRIDNYFAPNPDATYCDIAIAANDGTYTKFYKNFTPLFTTETLQDIGNSSDKWGNNGWTAANINHGFIVELTGMTENTREPPSWYVDYIQVYVYYTLGGQLKVNKVEAWEKLNRKQTLDINKINKVVNE